MKETFWETSQDALSGSARDGIWGRALRGYLCGRGALCPAGREGGRLGADRWASASWKGIPRGFGDKPSATGSGTGLSAPSTQSGNRASHRRSPEVPTPLPPLTPSGPRGHHTQHTLQDRLCRQNKTNPSLQAPRVQDACGPVPILPRCPTWWWPRVQMDGKVIPMTLENRVGGTV